MNLTLNRDYLAKCTTGVLTGPNDLLLCTLELPWNANQRNISCIPEGIYSVIKQSATQSRPYNFFRLPTVPGRSGILIHKITYVKDLKGCIGIGMKLSDINKDGIPDMIKSTEGLAKLWEVTPEQFTITIKTL